MRKKLWMYGMVTALVLGTSMMFTGCSSNSGDDGATTESEEAASDAASDSSSETQDTSEDEMSEDDTSAEIANGFSSYEDAHDYILSTLGNEDTEAKYEVKKKDTDLQEYQDGSKGYHFEVFDSADGSDKKLGDFYVDQKTGKIYKKNKDTNKAEEYTINE